MGPDWLRGLDELLVDCTKHCGVWHCFTSVALCLSFGRHLEIRCAGDMFDTWI